MSSRWQAAPTPGSGQVAAEGEAEGAADGEARPEERPRRPLLRTAKAQPWPPADHEVAVRARGERSPAVLRGRERRRQENRAPPVRRQRRPRDQGIPERWPGSGRTSWARHCSRAGARGFGNRDIGHGGARALRLGAALGPPSRRSRRRPALGF
eukprot:9211247-Pyramimonas_sp.AAC.1